MKLGHTIDIIMDQIFAQVAGGLGPKTISFLVHQPIVINQKPAIVSSRFFAPFTHNY